MTIPPIDRARGSDPWCVSTKRCTDGGKAQRLSVFLGLPGGTRGCGWYTCGGSAGKELITRTSWPEPGFANTFKRYKNNHSATSQCTFLESIETVKVCFEWQKGLCILRRKMFEAYHLFWFPWPWRYDQRRIFKSFVFGPENYRHFRETCRW